MFYLYAHAIRISVWLNIVYVARQITRTRLILQRIFPAFCLALDCKRVEWHTDRDAITISAINPVAILVMIPAVFDAVVMLWHIPLNLGSLCIRQYPLSPEVILAAAQLIQACKFLE